MLSGLEAMDGAGLAFSRRGIPVWSDIWLRSADPEYDIIGGGITILDSRTRESLGQRCGDLTSSVRVGALAGTTGEARLLEMAGLVDTSGILAAGTRVETLRGTVVADGTADLVITAAGSSANLEGRAISTLQRASCPKSSA